MVLFFFSFPFLFLLKFSPLKIILMHSPRQNLYGRKHWHLNQTLSETTDISVPSLRSRRLELVGARENVRTRGFLSALVSLSRAPIISCPTTSKHLLRRLLCPFHMKVPFPSVKVKVSLFSFFWTWRAGFESHEL